MGELKFITTPFKKTAVISEHLNLYRTQPAGRQAGKKSAVGKFIIKLGNKGQFYFSLKAANGQKILSSEAYNSKSACANGIDAVKNNAKDDSKYDRKESGNGKYYFNLLTANGHIIGTSEMYESTSGRDKGIESVQSNTAGASVEEE